MKKFSLLLSLFLVAAVVFTVGCKKDDEVVPPDECASSTFPSTTGTATVAVLNYTNSTIAVNAGDVLALAIQITKGVDRPQKLRVYQTDCANITGTQVTFDGQSGVATDGTIDLRNTDDPQVRNINYTVPTGMSTIYLNLVIDESGSKFTYKRLTLTVSGSGIIDTWSSVALGGNTNALASRMSSGTGLTYSACNAAANIGYIDITYAVSTELGTQSYICSNPARFLTPVSLTISNAACGEDGTLPTDGGQVVYFKTYAGSNFATATDADLTALTVSSSNTQYIAVTAVGEVFEFVNAAGRKGLIRVETLTSPNVASGSVTVSVKVQR